MHIFYRLSFGSYSKERFENATKGNCLQNFIKHCFKYRHDTLWIVLDNVGVTEKNNFAKQVIEHHRHFKTKFKGLRAEAEAIPFLETCNINWIDVDARSSAASFRKVMELALKLPDDEIVYFCEDDYAHLPDSRKVLLEGLERSHYVTLYNHPDKYIPATKGGNPLIGDDASEATKVFVTDSSYWMMTNSTTMTFATHVGILREDEDVWRKFTEGAYPQDMKIFLELRQKGRTLVQPIPTKATHCEPQWAAHLHGTGVNDWNEVLKC